MTSIPFVLSEEMSEFLTNHPTAAMAVRIYIRGLARDKAMKGLSPKQAAKICPECNVYVGMDCPHRERCRLYKSTAKK